MNKLKTALILIPAAAISINYYFSIDRPHKTQVLNTTTPQPKSCKVDCTLAPVDKTDHLDETFDPTIELTGLQGGGALIADASNDLRELFEAASQNGVELEVASAYRSFAAQSRTFDSWVAKELEQGFEQTEAENRANVYSAKPGHSEHQLGTAVDIKCKSCTAFKLPENQPAYTFIAKQAHNYGFVVSYPKALESLTGYSHEPWHIRWIGKDMARELHRLGYPDSRLTLSNFLKNQ